MRARDNLFGAVGPRMLSSQGWVQMFQMVQIVLQMLGGKQVRRQPRRGEASEPVSAWSVYARKLRSGTGGTGPREGPLTRFLACTQLVGSKGVSRPHREELAPRCRSRRIFAMGLAGLINAQGHARSSRGWRLSSSSRGRWSRAVHPMCLAGRERDKTGLARRVARGSFGVCASPTGPLHR